MYYTQEYTILISQDGGEDIVLKPGLINAFPAFKGLYKPTSSAMIIDVETKSIVAILNVKEVIDGIGIVPEVKATPKKVVKEEPVVDLLTEAEDG